MENEKDKFKLYASCLLTKGALRSTICDVQREKFEFIPNILYEILTEHDGSTIEEVVGIYGEENKDTIMEYFDFLKKNDFLFLTDEPERFPQVSLSTPHSAHITNCIIDFDRNSPHDLASIVPQLDALNCKSIQVRYHYDATIDELESQLTAITNSKVMSCYLLLPYCNCYQARDYIRLLDIHQRIRHITLHSCPQDAVLKTDDESIGLRVSLTEKAIDPEKHCGDIGPEHFRINLRLFSESNTSNTCLSHKLSIDKEGYLKNCPSMPQQFGLFGHLSLKEAIEKEGFRDYWKIKKDDIDVCQDCEFRHMCTDCRAFRSSTENRYSKPLKCDYDPYTAKWGDRTKLKKSKPEQSEKIKTATN